MISQEQLAQIGERLSNSTLDAAAVGRLRVQYPDIHFTYCLEDDVCGASPIVEREGFNLYLIDSQNHCLSLTRDMQIASGILVAELESQPLE